jgi:hypothetical protein
VALLSFLQGSTPDLQLYGKLPIAKDYLRIGLGEGMGVAWRSWLDQQFSTELERGQPRKVQWPVGFLLGAEKGDPLVGCMWNSTDAGGHRHFPFTLSVRRKRKSVGASARAGLTEVLSTWARLEELRRVALSCANGEELMGQLRGKQIPEGLPYQAPVENVGLSAWCSELWPGRGVEGLRESFECLRHEAASGSFPDLRLSLVPHLGWAQQVQAWCLLLERSAWLEDSKLPTLLVQYTGNGAGAGPAAVFVSKRPLSALDASNLCGGEAEGARPTLEFGAKSVGSEESAPELYPVECSLARAIRGELGD